MKLSRQELAVILVTVALLIVVGGVLALIFGQYSDWYTKEYSSIYLTSGDMKFSNLNEGLAFGNVQFKVHNAWKLNSKYIVHVLPAGDDFYFQLDGKWHSYLDIEDLTPAFNVVKNGSKFTVHAKDLTMQAVLSGLNEGKDIVIASDDVDATAHYMLIVGNGQHAVSIIFRCAINSHVGVGDVEIDPPSMVI